MQKNRIIFWAATGLFSAMMLMGAFNYFTNPAMVEGFKHLGFPDYFRVELGIAKILGALALLIPQVPVRVKEWAYAGFGFVLISAVLAHLSVGDPVSGTIAIFVGFLFLTISYIYRGKLTATV